MPYPDWFTAEQVALAEASAATSLMPKIDTTVPERGWRYVNGTYVLKGSEKEREFLPFRLTRKDKAGTLTLMDIEEGKQYRWWNASELGPVYTVLKIGTYLTFVQVIHGTGRYAEDTFSNQMFSDNVVPV